MATTTEKIYASDVNSAAAAVGYNFTEAQNNLMTAYALKEGASEADLVKAAKDLGITFKNPKEVSLRAIQLISEQRFQHASQILSLFSGILDKVDQMKQRIIAKFSNS